MKTEGVCLTCTKLALIRMFPCRKDIKAVSRLNAICSVWLCSVLSVPSRAERACDDQTTTSSYEIWMHLFIYGAWLDSVTLNTSSDEGKVEISKKIHKKIQEVDTYMELNMPIKAVKQKPMANMDFIRTCKQKGQRCLKQQAHTEVLWAHTLKKRLCTDHWNQQGKRMTQKTEGLSKWLGKSQRDWVQRQPQCGATDGKCCFRETKPKSAQELPSHLAWAVFSP